MAQKVNNYYYVKLRKIQIKYTKTIVCNHRRKKLITDKNYFNRQLNQS